MSLFIWDTRGKLLVVSLYLAEILFLLLLKHFFHIGAASNQLLLAPKVEKELNDRKIKKLNRLIAKIW